MRGIIVCRKNLRELLAKEFVAFDSLGDIAPILAVYEDGSYTTRLLVVSGKWYAETDIVCITNGDIKAGKPEMIRNLVFQTTNDFAFLRSQRPARYDAGCMNGTALCAKINYSAHGSTSSIPWKFAISSYHFF